MGPYSGPLRQAGILAWDNWTKGILADIRPQKWNVLNLEREVSNSRELPIIQVALR